MTTEATSSTRETRSRGTNALGQALAATLVIGLLVAVAGLIFADGAAARGAAARGAAVAVAIVLVVFGLGAVAVDYVARVLPSAALMIAMTTYALQVVLMALVFVSLERSDLLDSELDRDWLGATLIIVAFTWMTAQILTTTRARIPVYDLPSDNRVQGEGRAAVGGDR